MRKQNNFYGDCICLDVNAVFSILRKILYFHLKKIYLFILNYTCWLYAADMQYLTYMDKFLMIILTVHDKILTSEEGIINPSDGLFLLLYL